MVTTCAEGIKSNQNGVDQRQVSKRGHCGSLLYQQVTNGIQMKRPRVTNG